MMMFMRFVAWIAVAIALTAAYEHWTIEPTIEDSYLTALQHSRFRTSAHTKEYRKKKHNLHFLQNKTLVFFGDSVTRYQYLYLINYIHHYPRWNDMYNHSLCCEKRYNSWVQFYQSLPSLFGCSHFCDCRHVADTSNDPGLPQFHTHENMYFFDEDLNLSFNMINWIHGPSIGSSFFENRLPNQTDFQNYCRNFVQQVPKTFSQNITIRYDGIQAFVKAVIQPTVRGKVDAILFNHGLWAGDHQFLGAGEIADGYLAPLKEASPLVIWKTTTPKKGNKKPIDSQEYVEYIRQKLGVKIFDTYNYLNEVHEVQGMMWDEFHFMPFVNRELNIALLEHLEKWFQTNPKL